MIPSKSSKKRRAPKCRTAAVALASIVFVAAVVMNFSVLFLHGPNQFSYETASDYFLAPTSFGKHGKNATLMSASSNATRATDDKNATTTGACFSLNSQSWLKGPRLGNAPLDSDQVAMDLILNSDIQSTLQQTLCHADSRFLDWNHVGENSLNLAALRLVYLAFHVDQHEPAWKEARHRHAHCSPDDLLTHNIGNFDYECRDAKFLVVPLAGSAGLGAVMRLTVVNALLAGMATGRVVLFVNNASVGPSNIQEPWLHVSCDRQDMQCFFLPTSPCVLTLEELKNAHLLERSEMRKMFRHGNVTVDNRVVVTKIHTRPHMAPPNLRENLVAIAKKYILFNVQQDDNRAMLLQRAVELIYDIEPLQESQYYYFGSSSKVHHGAVFYAMRPRPEYSKILNDIVKESLPSDFDPNTTLGLAIRGSDKCTAESECLSFEQHMNAVSSVWKQHNIDANGGVANVILTTEDKQVMKDMKRYNNDDTRPHFITNKRDVLQGTGDAKEFEASSNNNVSAHDVLLSSVAAIQLQLSAKYAVGNCCSNFHNLIFDFVRNECGPVAGKAVCLQELDDPEFRVCCSWDKSDECTARRQALENKTTVSIKG